MAEQHQADVQLEYDAVARLNVGIELCRAKGDNGTRALLEEILKSEEDQRNGETCSRCWRSS